MPLADKVTSLQSSPSPNRTNPTPSAGQSVPGNIYIFASSQKTDFLYVQFYPAGIEMSLER